MTALNEEGLTLTWDRPTLEDRVEIETKSYFCGCKVQMKEDMLSIKTQM